MERSIIKKTGLLPSLVVSAFLIAGVIDNNRVEARTLPMQGTQVAWWGFYPAWGYGYYGPGYYRPVYWSYRPACAQKCYRTHRGYARCKVRCY